MIRRIAILGSGALGLYYGGRLALAGHEVCFLARRDLQHLRREGLTLDFAGEHHVVRPSLVAAEAAEIGPVDLAVITLKSTANHELSRLLPPVLGPNTLVVTLQNGLGVDEPVAALAGPARTLGALCFIGVNRVAPGTVACGHVGYLELGAFQPEVAGASTRLAVQAFLSSGIKASEVESLLGARWRKLVWNVAFNGLTIALGGIASNEVLLDREGERRARALGREVQAIARAEGIEIPDTFLIGQIEKTRGMHYLPSTLLDWRAGLPLELDAIWGEPLRRARQHGVSTPELARLERELRELAANRPKSTC